MNGGASTVGTWSKKIVELNWIELVWKFGSAEVTFTEEKNLCHQTEPHLFRQNTVKTTQKEKKTSGKTVKYSLNNIKPFHNRIHFNTMLLDTVVWRSGDKKRTYQPRCWTMDVSHRWSDLFKLEKPHNSTSQVVTFRALCALFQASKLSLSMKSIWNKRKHWILLEQTEIYKYTTHQQIANFSRNKSS